MAGRGERGVVENISFASVIGFWLCRIGRRGIGAKTKKSGLEFFEMKCGSTYSWPSCSNSS